MRITRVTARVYEWTGPVAPIHANFCTTAGDILTRKPSSISAYSFLGWMVVEIETDTGLLGLGNAALSPHVTKAVIEHRNFFATQFHPERSAEAGSRLLMNFLAQGEA